MIIIWYLFKVHALAAKVIFVLLFRDQRGLLSGAVTRFGAKHLIFDSRYSNKN